MKNGMEQWMYTIIAKLAGAVSVQGCLSYRLLSHLRGWSSVASILPCKRLRSSTNFCHHIFVHEENPI